MLGPQSKGSPLPDTYSLQLYRSVHLLHSQCLVVSQTEARSSYVRLPTSLRALRAVHLPLSEYLKHPYITLIITLSDIEQRDIRIYMRRICHFGVLNQLDDCCIASLCLVSCRCPGPNCGIFTLYHLSPLTIMFSHLDAIAPYAGLRTFQLCVCLLPYSR